MLLKQLIEKLQLEVLSAEDRLEREIKRGYSSDLLSDVLANGCKGDLWVTLQIHENIVAVAAVNELAGIIVINGRKPNKDTIDKANRERIPILVSSLPAFELIGMLYSMGISGMKG
jgi:hypothetical protein